MDERAIRAVAEALTAPRPGPNPAIPYLRAILAELKSIKRAEILSLIEIGLVAVTLPAACEYFTSADERRTQKHYQAWQVIALAEGARGTGGRIEAMQDLNRSGVKLRGVAAPHAILDGIELPRADLKFARLDSASLYRAKLAGSFLAHAGMKKAYLRDAVAHDADFAFLENGDSANFYGARLCRSIFIGALLRGADFSTATLHGADFRGADLRGAFFTGDSLPPGILLRDANVAGLRASRLFLRAALDSGAVAETDSAWGRRREIVRGKLNQYWHHTDSVRLERIGRARLDNLRCGPEPLPGE